MDINPEIIGMIAAVLTTTGYIPQAVKVIREKNTTSISLGMYIIMTLGAATWFTYGLMIESLPVTLANGFTGCIIMIILVMKLRHG